MAARPLRTILRAVVVSLALVGTSLAVTPAATADTEPGAGATSLLDPIGEVTCGLLNLPVCPTPPTAPNTTITDMTPKPNKSNWVNRRAVTVTFAHSYPEGEEPPATDENGNPTPDTTYECSVEGPQPRGWAACSSPHTFTGLPDTDSGKPEDVHILKVRAVHPDGETKDDTPAATDGFRLDATRPRTQDLYTSPELVGPGPFGSILLANRIDFTYIGTGLPLSFRCTFDGRNVPCADGGNGVGRHTIANLSPGAHRFTANAVDQAGNTAPNPLSVDFAVPYNRVGTKKQVRRMWSRVAAPNHYRGDYVTTRKNGSFLSRRFTNFTEAHLVVAKGPRHGRIRVDLGNTRVKVQRLGAKKFRTKQLVKLNIPEGRAVSGRIKVTVISPSGRPVMIDAIVVR